MTPASRRTSLPILVLGAALTLLGAAAGVRPPSLAVSLEAKIYDSFLRSAPRRPVAGAVAVVDIDEASLDRLGQWPWPRYRVARLLEKIREGGAAAVGLDMVFAEPDRTSLALLSEELRSDLGTGIALAGLPPEAVDTDRVLARTLAAGPFVLGYQFDFDAPRGTECLLHPLGAAVHASGGADGALGVFDAPGVVCNLPRLSAAAGASGFFNVTPDPDGVLRRVPLVIRHGGRLYPSLALAVYREARGGDAVLETDSDGVAALRLSDRTIPLDRRGNLLVNYRGRHRTFPHVSAGDLLDGTVDPTALAGKIVLLGTTSAGLKEIRTTPFDAAQPGVEIHATVLDNLLAGDPVAVPSRARVLQLLLVLVPGLLLTSLMCRARPLWGLTAVGAFGALIWLGSFWLLARRQVFLGPVVPAGTLALVFMMLTTLRFLQADRLVRERTRRLALTQDAIIQSLAALAETRHHETGGHIQRTREYMRVLATRLKDHPRFRDYLHDTTVELLYRLAPLHDIGKVGVRDRILLKSDSLTPEEYEEMKRHTVLGSETIRMAKSLLGEDAFLKTADEIAFCHHERWDGTGYPRGLAGEQIPIPGRLMAVADAYDAAISTRLYKPALPHDEAVQSLVEKRGTYFDPDVVDAFLSVSDEFRRIAARFAGAGVEPEPPGSA